ncbi:MAG: malate synthase A [Gemmatimonadales bacterium]
MTGRMTRELAQILTPEALAFIARLHRRFESRRQELLARRAARQKEFDAGALPGFLDSTKHIRESQWKIAAQPRDLLDRRVEITGPTDRKMVINALNSGARGFMADFEDANAPTWRNQVAGHANLRDAIERTITYDGSDGRHYALKPQVATLLVRPRGWHLPEKHVTAGGEPIAGALLDFGLHAFHNAARLHRRGSGVYLYLPKLEHHLEARLWNEIFTFTEDALGLPAGTIRATVLIETLPAALQMHEILYELRGHGYGLNAGRWDYLFSMIKCFRNEQDHLLPDRRDVTMTVPFMRAYTELLVQTCHARGTFAMGGMAALIPSRTNPEANARAIAAVEADKRREATDGFDGTWVAHPDVVGVARAEFDKVLGERPHQIDRRRDDVRVTAEQVLDVGSTPGAITEAGLRTNVNVAFRYVSFWLTGRGAAGINNLMEDAATAEISRAQIWQWIRHGQFTRERVRQILDEEMRRIHDEVGEEIWKKGRARETREVFERVALADDFPNFLTLPAYEYLD